MMKMMTMTLLLWIAGMSLASGDLSAKQTAPADQTTGEVPDAYYLISGEYFKIDGYSFFPGQDVTGYHMLVYRDGKSIAGEPHILIRDSWVYFNPIQGSDSGGYLFMLIDNTGKEVKRHTIWITVYDPI